MNKITKEYLNNLDNDKFKEAFTHVVNELESNLPPGFKWVMQYKMPTLVVPLSRYPKGYHVTPDVPLPFISIAAQKNHLSIYHMGIYMNQKVHDWFVSEYEKLNIGKLDMGKSCIRFRNPKKIPYDLLGELFSKIGIDDYINGYETSLS